MSKAKLIKQLRELSKEEIINVVTELYDVRRDAKDYLEYWLNPDIDSAADKAEKAINKLYFLPSGKSRKSPSQTEAKKIIQNFHTLSYDVETTIRLRLLNLEKYLDWSATRRNPGAHQERIDKIIADLKADIEKNNLSDRFSVRLESLKKRKEEIFRAEPEYARPPRRRGFGWMRF